MLIHIACGVGGLIIGYEFCKHVTFGQIELELEKYEKSAVAEVKSLVAAIRAKL